MNSTPEPETELSDSNFATETKVAPSDAEKLRGSVHDYLGEPSVYLDVAMYCAATFPQVLTWWIDTIHEKILEAKNPDLKCRMFLKMAKCWKDFAPYLDKDAQNGLINLLCRISFLDEERGCVILAYLRKLTKGLARTPSESGPNDPLPRWMHGPPEAEPFEELDLWDEPQLGELIRRGDELAELERASCPWEVAPEDCDGEPSAAVSSALCSHFGYPIPPGFWRQPFDGFDHLPIPFE